MRLTLTCLAILSASVVLAGEDHLRELQSEAIKLDYSPIAHWGVDPQKYTQWGSHSNRLIPVYAFGTKGAGKGIDLDGYQGENSPYRSEDALRRIYGYVPTDSVHDDAVWMDQTNICDIQRAALKAGKKHIILVVFDGMDWNTTQAAAIYNTRSVPYTEGRGRGTHFQEYTAGGNTQYGFMVTSPHNNGTKVDVNAQTVKNPGGEQRGGYNPRLGGAAPWIPANPKPYLIGQPKTDPGVHAYTDSSSSASSMTAGIKTYNNSINVDYAGAPVVTIAHQAQEKGYAVGAVTSVPIPHATPACTYAHNVDRDDYQDLTRDLIGRPSVAHPNEPLPGMDVVIGAGYGTDKDEDKGQGKNFVPGNRYLVDEDLKAINVENGGKYVVATRQKGVDGGESIAAAAKKAAESGKRLFGFYGAGSHLPFQTADGGYNPAPGRAKAEKYTQADIDENPTLAEMTSAALSYLQTRPNGFWLLVESGDVDWANHDDNLDNSIGAVNSGDAAVKAITDWVEQNSSWDETVLIVTADHGHYLVLDKPEGLIPPSSNQK
jgi:alkaline phosphatase